MVILTVKNNIHLLISILPILLKIYNNSTDQSHLVNKSFTVFSTRGQEARQRDELRRILNCVLCIYYFNLFFLYFVFLFCTFIGVCSNNNNNNNNNNFSASR